MSVLLITPRQNISILAAVLTIGGKLCRTSFFDTFLKLINKSNRITVVNVSVDGE
jgi:hypothetical protein